MLEKGGFETPIGMNYSLDGFDVMMDQVTLDTFMLCHNRVM